MVVIQAIDEHSQHLSAVKDLWREHSDTLGFLPAGAFVDYARDRHILVALQDSVCVGYLLYRVVRDRATVAHFCVATGARRQGVARALMDSLVASTRKCRGIVLSCRRDFDASKTWPRLGFHPIGELQGRAKGGSDLVRWLLDFGHADLFTNRGEPGSA